MADATEKKYVDLTGLGLYDAKIKALFRKEDATNLQAAKDYADGLADNYEPAGAAKSAYDKALADAKTYADGKDAAISAAQTQADKGVADAAKAQTAADKAQGEVDALETLVGTIPAGATATTVTGYVDEKVAAASDTTALAARVTAAEGEIDAIQADYLVEADKTELQSNIDAVGGKVTTLIGTDTGKSVRTIANEELAAQLIPEGAKESLDTLQEIAAWIQAHPDDASAMNAAITALQTLVGTIPEDATAENIVAYIQEVVAAEKSRAEGVEGGLNNRLTAIETKFGDGEGSVADMIADAVKAEEEARKAADQAHDTAIAAAKKAGDDAQADVDALEEVVATKAAQSDLTALTGRVTTAEGEIDALQAASHTHDNKTVLDGITAQLISNWNTAYTNNHTHANKTTLDGITDALVSKWNAAEANAKSYTDAEIAKFVPVTETEINNLFPTV